MYTCRSRAPAAIPFCPSMIPNTYLSINCSKSFPMYSPCFIPPQFNHVVFRSSSIVYLLIHQTFPSFIFDIFPLALNNAASSDVLSPILAFTACLNSLFNTKANTVDANFRLFSSGSPSSKVCALSFPPLFVLIASCYSGSRLDSFLLLSRSITRLAPLS